jgi:ElaB/YqjD/DUF883 family membrane-anchored ribosome-binding protein
MKNQSQVKDIIFDTVPETERLIELESNCNAIEKEWVSRDFTQEEMSDMKTELSTLAIDRNDLEIELKELGASLRKQIKSLKSRESMILVDLKAKKKDTQEKVYHFIEREEDRVCVYDNRGHFLYQRPLKPNERQHSILEFNRSK